MESRQLHTLCGAVVGHTRNLLAIDVGLTDFPLQTQHSHGGERGENLSISLREREKSSNKRRSFLVVILTDPETLLLREFFEQEKSMKV